MDEPILRVRVDREASGRLRVLSPGVGYWLGHPRPGTLLEPGSRVGTLEHLNRRYALVLPDAAAGRLHGELPRERAVPVEYGQVLFSLLPAQPEAPPAGPGPRPPRK
jgi:hypothetical protein